jgi:hypothetical protein
VIREWASDHEAASDSAVALDSDLAFAVGWGGRESLPRRFRSLRRERK